MYVGTPPDATACDTSVTSEYVAAFQDGQGRLVRSPFGLTGPNGMLIASGWRDAGWRDLAPPEFTWTTEAH